MEKVRFSPELWCLFSLVASNRFFSMHLQWYVLILNMELYVFLTCCFIAILQIFHTKSFKILFLYHLF